jgi:hypothetical protein
VMAMTLFSMPMIDTPFESEPTIGPLSVLSRRSALER